MGALAARSRALAVLRIRSRALAVALLPAAVAVVLLAGEVTGRIGGGVWDAVRWAVTSVAVVVLLAAAGVAAVIARARPAVSPTVELAKASAPDLYRLVEDLAGRLDVPVPSAIALTPDCDSWLEDRTHPATHRAAHPKRAGAPKRVAAAPAISGGAGRSPTAPVLVIGSPFLWWMRVAELRAVLAPVVAGTGPSAHPDIAAARRFVRGLDAAVGAAARPGLGPLRGPGLGLAARVAKLLLHSCRVHAAEMERGVAAAASERAQTVDYGLRIVAQEQVGLAYAGWDRLLTRVALPAWRMGRWPSRLDAGVVSALTELSRRDRLAEGFASRLGERPACDLLEEPGTVDEAASLLAARLFHGGPAEGGADWSPVDWQAYPEEVVDRKWRTEAARLHRVLDALGVRPAAVAPSGPNLARVVDYLAGGTPGLCAHGVALGSAPHDSVPHDSVPHDSVPHDSVPHDSAARSAPQDSAAYDSAVELARESDTAANAGISGSEIPGPIAEPVTSQGADSDAGCACRAAQGAAADEPAPEGAVPGDDLEDEGPGSGPGSALAAGISAEVAREEAAREEAARERDARCGAGAGAGALHGVGDAVAIWGTEPLPLFPLQPPRTARELLADHVTAMVCCAAVDTAGAVPGLDWLDGPALLIAGERSADLGGRVRSLVEDGDPDPLRDWFAAVGIRPEKPVRLV
ncbi:hypothetical protein [Streptomyces sp. FIT100]|uniref:hypothetical protein n=1 Tax=Streptomyces sp. FIT100 TaxID=2837956 RepID=UPI0021CA3DFF|nr:hypothetical protein [Streptomyces sp. FIT100]UUN31249.1 hypothetical protein KK483_16540 [Streptomyces sp. FIT100]